MRMNSFLSRAATSSGIIASRFTYIYLRMNSRDLRKEFTAGILM